MSKRIILIAVVLASLVILYNFAGQILESLQASSRVEQETDRLALLQRKNAELRGKLSEVQNIQFIEQQARDKLNYSRPGETVVVIPQEELDRVIGVQKNIEEVIIPNWQGWLKLFLH